MSGEVIPCDDQRLSGSEPGGAQPHGLVFDSLRGWRIKSGLRGIEERVGCRPAVITAYIITFLY